MCNYAGIIGLVLYLLGGPKGSHLSLKHPYLSLRDYNDVSHTSTPSNVLLAYYWRIIGVLISNNTGLKGSEPHALEDLFLEWFCPQIT